jgi:broad specificity phosphatase PhoE
MSSGASSGSSDCSRWPCGASRIKSSEARHLILVKHASPQVDVETPAHEWRLSHGGTAGAAALADRLRAADYAPTKIVASLEAKATQTGSIIAERLRLPFATVEGLHEHDRRAAGFLSTEVFATRMRDLFAQPDAIVFGNESASIALARFGKAVDQVVSEETGDVIIVSHGTVMSLFVASRARVNASELWAVLGLPSYVSLELPNHRIVEIVAAI